jgi:hypothetical protein
MLMLLQLCSCTHHGALEHVIGLNVLKLDSEGLLSTRGGGCGLSCSPDPQCLSAALEGILAPHGLGAAVPSTDERMELQLSSC